MSQNVSQPLTKGFTEPSQPEHWQQSYQAENFPVSSDLPSLWSLGRCLDGLKRDDTTGDVRACSLVCYLSKLVLWDTGLQLAGKDEGWRWIQSLQNLWDSEAFQGLTSDSTAKSRMCPCRKRQTPHLSTRNWKEIFIDFTWVKLLWGGTLVAISVQITNMGGGFKKASESPNPCCGLGHGIIKELIQRDVATCRIICALPILSALGGFNKTKNVKLKPNLYFF